MYILVSQISNFRLCFFCATRFHDFDFRAILRSHSRHCCSAIPQPVNDSTIHTKQLFRYLNVLIVYLSNMISHNIMYTGTWYVRVTRYKIIPGTLYIMSTIFHNDSKTPRLPGTWYTYDIIFHNDFHNSTIDCRN